MSQTTSELGEQLQGLDILLGQLKEKEQRFQPTRYGLPDLLMSQETSGKKTFGAFDAYRRDMLADFITNQLYGVKKQRKFHIDLIPPMVTMIGDLFYQHVQRALLWKARGCGGSLCASIVMWLAAVYRHMSFLEMGGSTDQSKYIYEYTTGFWNCFPELADAYLLGEPLMQQTRLRNGVTLQTIGASEKRGRGSHVPGYIADEANQEHRGVDKAFRAAMQGALSEEDHLILVLSTFQHPEGFFQELHDEAEELGFTVYKWDVIDAMQTCREGLETATVDDPRAQAYCQSSCSLTSLVEVRNSREEVTGHTYKWCNGRARTSVGFHPKSYAVNAEEINRGTETFDVEYMCTRPGYQRYLYPESQIQAALTDEFHYDSGAPVAVGIDWALATQTAVVLLVEGEDPSYFLEHSDGKRSYERCLGLTECRFFIGRPTAEVVRFLKQLRAEYGAFPVLNDTSSHGGQLCNMEVSQAGFETVEVNFTKWKDLAIENVQKYFAFGKLRILAEHQMLIRQLKKHRRDKSGRIKKVDDHGPDALLCAGLNFIYSLTFGEEDREQDVDARQVLLLGGDA